MNGLQYWQGDHEHESLDATTTKKDGNHLIRRSYRFVTRSKRSLQRIAVDLRDFARKMGKRALSRLNREVLAKVSLFASNHAMKHQNPPSKAAKMPETTDTRPKPSLHSLLSRISRWAWLASLLLLVTLGYLSAGLSDPAKGSSDPAGDDETIDAPQKVNTRTLLADDSIGESIQRLDSVRAESIVAAGLESAAPADWMTVCRRMSLALVGSGMSVEEIRELQRLPVQQRQQVHLDRLLTDPRFHNYWAERYTRFLVGADEGPFIVYRRRRFRTWLSDAFGENRRYDAIVRDLITAEGLWTDRPEVNFYTVTFDSGDGAPDPVRLAARTSRTFLGLRIDCLQCHDDFLGNVNLGDAVDPREGLQSDFHQLAAFFSAAKVNGLQRHTQR